MMAPTAGEAPPAVTRFYDALQRRDVGAIATCYHPDARFRDPVFGTLSREETLAMWRMLLGPADDLAVTAEPKGRDGARARVYCTATYTLPATGRRVRNRLDARFLLQDGLILEHRDRFSLWRWSGMALGTAGWLLGWTPLMRAAVRKRARRALKRHIAREKDASQGAAARS